MGSGPLDLLSHELARIVLETFGMLLLAPNEALALMSLFTHCGYSSTPHMWIELDLAKNYTYSLRGHPTAGHRRL